MTDVFSAVADPTRRAILDRLRDGASLSVKELAEPMQMSRQAVTKHLDQLVEAGLIQQERLGRERRHRLRSAPLQDLHAWLEPYAAAWDRRLARLEAHLAAETETPSPPDND